MTTGHLHSSIMEMNRFFKEIEATRSCLFENVICSAAWDLVWQGTWALWRLTNCSPVICVHCSPNRHQMSSPKGWQWQSLVSSSSISRCWCFGEWNNLFNTPWLKGPSSVKISSCHNVTFASVMEADTHSSPPFLWSAQQIWMWIGHWARIKAHTLPSQCNVSTLAKLVGIRATQRHVPLKNITNLTKEDYWLSGNNFVVVGRRLAVYTHILAFAAQNRPATNCRNRN